MNYSRLKGSFLCLAASALTLSLLSALPNPSENAAIAEVPPTSPQLAQADSVSPIPAGAMPTAGEVPTLAEIATNRISFTTLATALDAADLVDVLNSTGPFTVFAPTDEAFEALPPEAIEALLLPENKEALIELLTYHVVPGVFLSSDLETGEVVTVEGSTVAIEIGDTITVNSAQIIDTDVVASNGVIHTIDRVIIPSADPAAE